MSYHIVFASFVASMDMKIWDFDVSNEEWTGTKGTQKGPRVARISMLTGLGRLCSSIAHGGNSQVRNSESDPGLPARVAETF